MAAREISVKKYSQAQLASPALAPIGPGAIGPQRPDARAAFPESWRGILAMPKNNPDA